ncbi:reverse transcriptase domain-containing protein [Tanacetum coccineum]
MLTIKGSGKEVTVTTRNNKTNNRRSWEHTLLGLEKGKGMLEVCVFATSRPPVANQKPVVTCFGCGAEGHFKSKCQKLKNQNRGEQNGKKGKACEESSVVTYNDYTLGNIFPPRIVGAGLQQVLPSMDAILNAIIPFARRRSSRSVIAKLVVLY